jgi:phosphonate transport system permease protein
MGRHADALDYRRDAPEGINLCAYVGPPRLFGQFLAYNLYRWRSSCARARSLAFLA